MNFSVTTKDFLNKYVFPHFEEKILNSDIIQTYIDFIEEKYEKPLSFKIATGEIVDYDFFNLINNVLNDLSLNR